RAGRLLAAMTRGEDVRPLTVTPAPARLSLRVRFAEPLPAERVLVALPVVTARLAARLQVQGRRAGSLGGQGWWGAGGVQQARVHLRGHTAEAAALARELRRLLVSLLSAPQGVDSPILAVVRSAKEVGRVGEVGDVSDADDGLAEGAIGALRVTMGE